MALWVDSQNGRFPAIKSGRAWKINGLRFRPGDSLPRPWQEHAPRRLIRALAAIRHVHPAEWALGRCRLIGPANGIRSLGHQAVAS